MKLKFKNGGNFGAKSITYFGKNVLWVISAEEPIGRSLEQIALQCCHCR
jgi:hypothetical protein